MICWWSWGAASDQCAENGKTQRGTDACAEDPDQRAAIRRYAYLGGGRWSSDFTLVARGLRNSPALVRHASGTLLQAENSLDRPTPDAPFEEMNIVFPGAPLRLALLLRNEQASTRLDWYPGDGLPFCGTCQTRIAVAAARRILEHALL